MDVQNARVQQVFQGADIAELPTTRDVPGLLLLVPGARVGSIARRLQRRHRDLLQPDRAVVQLARRRATTPSGRTRGGSWWTAWSSTRRPGRDQRQHRQRQRDHHRHRERAGGVVHAVGQPRRVGDRRRVHQHRAAHRRQPFCRELLHQLPANAVLRPQPWHAPQRDAGLSRSTTTTTTSTARLAGRSRGTGSGSTSSAGNRGDDQYPQGGSTPGFSNLNEGKFGANYVPDRSNGSLTYTQRVQEGQRSPDAAGDAEEQVQHLLGRAVLLHEPLLRHDQRRRLARGVLFAAVVPESADAVVVDQPVHEPDAVRSRPDLCVDAPGHDEAPGVHELPLDSPRLRNRADRRT